MRVADQLCLTRSGQNPTVNVQSVIGQFVIVQSCNFSVPVSPGKGQVPLENSPSDIVLTLLGVRSGVSRVRISSVGLGLVT